MLNTITYYNSSSVSNNFIQFQKQWAIIDITLNQMHNRRQLRTIKTQWFGQRLGKNPVFHGDASPRVRCAHPSHPTHPGWGVSWWCVSPCTLFGESRGDARGCVSPMWETRLPERGTFGRPPQKGCFWASPFEGGCIPPRICLITLTVEDQSLRLTPWCWFYFQSSLSIFTFQF